jgi:hypothetical protein
MPEQLTAEHISRIIELRDHLIELGPDKFEMMSWFTIQDDVDSCNTFGWDELIASTDRATDLLNSGEKCGTAACIAGHAVLLWPDLIHYEHDYPILDHSEVAAHLGMNVGAPNVEQSERWFATASWPDRYRIPYYNLVGDLRRAQCQIRDDKDEYLRLEMERTFAQRKYQHDVVIGVMDDLIHGRMLNWHDEDTTAVDAADLADAQEV